MNRGELFEYSCLQYLKNNMLHHLKRHLLIEIVKECFSQACLHCMRKTQIHTAFERYTVLCHTAYMVQIYNMRSAAAVKAIKC